MSCLGGGSDGEKQELVWVLLEIPQAKLMECFYCFLKNNLGSPFRPTICGLLTPQNTRGSFCCGKGSLGQVVLITSRSGHFPRVSG